MKKSPAIIEAERAFPDFHLELLGTETVNHCPVYKFQYFMFGETYTVSFSVSSTRGHGLCHILANHFCETFKFRLHKRVETE